MRFCQNLIDKTATTSKSSEIPTRTVHIVFVNFSEDFYQYSEQQSHLS